MDTNSSRLKNRFASAVLGLTVLLLGGLVNLPYRYIERDGRWIGNLQAGDTDVDRRVDHLPTMAGWPFRYWVYYEHEGDVQQRYWSPLHLAWNVVMSVLVATLVFGFTQWRFRMIVSARNRHFTRRLFDISVAIFILLIPLVAYMHADRAKAKQWQTIGQATRFGNCYVSTWLPEPIVDRLPSNLVDTLSRIRHARLNRATDEIISLVVASETLTSLEFTGGDFTASPLEPLSANVHFNAISITGRDLDESLVDSVSRLPWLTELFLDETNLDSTLLRRLDAMQNLRRVGLRNTKVRLSQLGRPDWSATVEHLRLPRPAEGVADELTLDGWPRLRMLTIVRRTLRLNDETLSLRLLNLPKLEVLFLDRVQKHSLTAKNLPRFLRIEEDVQTLFFALGITHHVPGLTWLSELHLENLASMRRIGCYARDLESLFIENAPGLRHLELGSYQVHVGGTAKLDGVDRDRCQQWIHSLGASDGPVMLDLTALPMDHIDLSALVENPRIRHLRLGNSGVTFQQIQHLSGMSQLEKLDLRDCPLEANQLVWLVDHLPNLTDLLVDVGNLETLDLTSRAKLRYLKTTRFERLRHLRLEDVPNLYGFLHFARTPQQFTIRNAPSLRGIAMEQPWPASAQIDGLRDLEWFSVGGPAVDDSVVDALLSCETMDRLTLAHASVSRQKLMQLGKFRELTVLNLPGAPVDDEVTAGWQKLKRLQEVNLDDSKISVGTFAWLSGIDSLRRLAINRVNVDDAAADALGGFVQLTALELADTSMNPDSLIRLLHQDTLERLDLSGWQLNSELLDALTNCRAMEWLTMHRCKVGEAALARILEQNPDVRIDLGEYPNGYSAGMIAKLQQRIASRPGRFLMKGISTIDNTFELIDSHLEPHEVFAAGTQQRGPQQRFYVPGEIDPDQFRPGPSRVR